MKLLNRIASDLRLMLHRPPRQQYAALCYRKKKPGDIEILLLTSRDTGRWIIPKGWPMEGKKAHAVAEREAFEEGGIRGKVEKKSIGTYSYDKKLANGLTIVCLVQVHALEVEELVKNFPEKGSRRSEWVSAEEAASRVNEPELKVLIRNFAQKMRMQPPTMEKTATGG